jgi:glycosyltransferase involved in cell wall biosynthesis
MTRHEFSQAPITVAIPIGPYPHNTRWVDEAIDSALAQVPEPREVLLIDDMSDYNVHHRSETVKITHWRSPWRLGVAHAFNFCVAVAQEQHVLMLGSDDRLMPRCLESCVRTLQQNHWKDAYYWLGIRFSDGRPDQQIPVNAAVTTKRFWQLTGGFPVETASGAPDAHFRRLLHVHFQGSMIPIANGAPLYWYRAHEEIYTATRPQWWGVIQQTSDVLMGTWEPPRWGRYE